MNQETKNPGSTGRPKDSAGSPGEAPEFNIEKMLGYRINRCAILMKQELQRRFIAAGYHITPEDWVILNRLWEEDGLNQNEISKRTIKDKTTVTRFIQGLEKEGWVHRKPDEKDRRNNHVLLTAKGRNLKGKLIPIVLGFTKEAGMGIDPAHMKITFETLCSLETNLLNQIEQNQNNQDNENNELI